MRRANPGPLNLALLLIGAHSLALGASLLMVPGPILELAHWPDAGPAFFPAQCGLFLMILGGFYVAGLWHRPYAWTVVGSKGVAVVFLVSTAVLGLAPSVVGWLAVVDGAMGVLVLVLLRRETRGL